MGELDRTSYAPIYVVCVFVCVCVCVCVCVRCVSVFHLESTKAPQAAGKIHMDFEKGFVVAEVSEPSSLFFVYSYIFLLIIII